MSKISQKDIDYIFDNIDIVDLVSEYVKLEKRGRNYIGLCPFHNEKTPSFTVSPEKKISHCFGCGKGGNIFQFLSEIEGLNFNQAIYKLGSRLGLNIEKDSNDNFNLSDEKDVMYYSHVLIADYYNYILLNTKEAEKALDYLFERGITIDTIKKFNIGYAPPGRNIAVSFFNSHNLNLDYVVNSGILGKSNGEYYDVFKDRIIFPIKDNNDKVVAFSGRTMSKEKEISKYYNTHETQIFEKRKVLFNFSEARHHIKKENSVIISEGYMDVISSYQENVKNVVALMGTNIDENILNDIFKLTDKFTLALDNDGAGIEAAFKIGNSLIKKTDNVFKLSFSGAKDIDEFIHKKKSSNSLFSFYDYSKDNITHFIEYKIEYYNSTIKNLEDKIKYKNELVENISFIEDEVLRDLLITKLSNDFSIDKNILLRELSNSNNKRQINTKQKLLSSNNFDFKTFYGIPAFDKKICKLFKYFFINRDYFLSVYDEFEGFTFKNSIFNELFNVLVIYYNNYKYFYVHKFINNINNVELVNLIKYIDNTDFLISQNEDLSTIKEYIKYIKKSYLFKDKVDSIKTNLQSAIIEADYEAQIKMLSKLKKYKK
ncbi:MULTISPECIES: DNA primase [unclassified Gemella]|uniref:DNA primase n=1 Tax=unclassified Gemella TaxID=2624949 RepID=UPI001C04EE83|nr:MULTISPECIES: DNA primase [unclassified Gemella]MBU0278137.1 DNA primase [Gemella sp. zg-1178]QWQ38338.1 DNA primase [Gemella sp. zg-570]